MLRFYTILHTCLRKSLSASAYAVALTIVVLTSVQAQTVVVADAYIDVINGKSVPHARIEITDGRITSISSNKSKKVSEGEKLIDLSGHTLLPGLIDTHVHLTSSATQHGFKRLTIVTSTSYVLPF